MTSFDERTYESARAEGVPQHANGKAAQSASSSRPQPFDFVLSRDISLEPKEFLISGFLGRHEVSAWYGPPDSAKSALKVYAQACVASGIDFCGRRVLQGPCLFVAAERGAIIRRRILAWCKEHELPDIPLAVVDHAIDLRSGQVDTARIIATADDLGRVCGTPPVWICFDTLNRVLAGGDENSPKDMGLVMAAVDRIHRETRAHVSLTHHVPVDRTDRMRGHGLILGAVDATVRVTKNDVVQVETDKANDLVDKPAFTFGFKSIVLHVNPESGVETTAPVLVPIDSGPAKLQPKGGRMPKAAQIAMRALRKAVEEVGDVPAASNNIPPRMRVASVEQWRQYAYASGISTSGEARARQQAFRRASEWLIGAGQVGVWNEQTWPI